MSQSQATNARLLTPAWPLFPSIVLQTKPAINRGVDETPEEIPSATTEIADQKVLGETPEAVKPCLEEYEQDKGTLMPQHVAAQELC
ncbi:MAG: hypothetical protein B7X03_00995 [Parcubacteria group bacterium 21-58-10]|nr:MAG: hypothetical protein B7X03_00995 [Parcubacteria group bacterium 21-58-10]